TFDQRVLGDDRAGVVALGQHLQRGAGESPLLLDRLVGIGVAADVDRADLVAGFRQFGAQYFGEVGLGADPRFEVQPRREVEVAVAGPGKAINTSMLAPAIRVHRLVEGDVGRVVAGDDAARALLGDLGARARRGLVQQQALPAVVLGVVTDGLEAPLRVGGGAAALDRLRWKDRVVHRRSVARGHLNRRDTFVGAASAAITG